MRMKSAVGPELLVSSPPQSAGLSRNWMATQKMGAPPQSPTGSNAGAAPAVTSFRSFFNLPGSFSARLDGGEATSEALDSGLEPSLTAPAHSADSNESSTTRKHPGRNEETDSSEQSAAPLSVSAAMQAQAPAASGGEAPVVLFLPNSPAQGVQLAHQARLEATSAIPHADLHSSMGEMSSAAAPVAQTLPTIPSSSQKGQSVKLASEAPMYATVSVSATVSPAAPSPSGTTYDARSLDSTHHPSVGGSKSHLQEDAQEDTPFDSVSATLDSATRNVQSASTSQETPFQTAAVVPSIHAGVELQLEQSVSRAQPAPLANQTQAIQRGPSKVSRQNESEPAQPQTAVAAPTTEKHADFASMAHDGLNRPVTASGPTGADHLTKEMSAPTLANPSLGANAPEGATTLARTSMSKAGSDEPLAILDNNAQPPAAAWTHAGTNKVEAGFQDPSLGWVGVRATTDSSGLHAAVLPSSPDASRMLSGSMADLGAYLTEQRHSVQSLTMAPPTGAGNAGSSYDGAALTQDNAQQRGYGQQSGTNSETAPETRMHRESMSSVSGETIDSVASSSIYFAPGGALISVFA